MAAATTRILRPGVVLRARSDGGIEVREAVTGARHVVPPALLEAASEAIARGRVPPPEEGTPDPLPWFEARHLLASARATAVEAWGAIDPSAPAPGRIELIASSRFRCHGCGLCCESYLVGPVSERERATILEGAEALAPHVATPREAWFTPADDDGGAGEGTWSLGRLPGGRCVFLGPDGLCEVHRRLGGERKPVVCRAFPLVIAARPDGLTANVNLECGSLARSREDGIPLAEQLEWIASIAEHADARRSSSLVLVHDDVLVPYRLARAIERRANALMAAAPRVEQALLAVRDLVLAVRASLPQPVDAAALEACLSLVREAPLAALRALGPGPVERRRALHALRDILRILAPLARALAEGGGGIMVATKALDLAALAADAFELSLAALEGEAGAPGSEARALLSVDAGAARPDVADLARALYAELAASGRPLFAGPGIVFGYAFMSLHRELTAFTARLVAHRRGAAQALPEDWNRAVVAVERTLKNVPLGALAPLVTAFIDLPDGKAE